MAFRSRLVAGLLALAAAPLLAEEAPSVSADLDQLPEVVELRKELAKRQLELFELDFQPQEFGRIAIDGQYFNYLKFTLRNRATASSEELQVRARGYNEVLKSLTEQYQSVKITSGAGVKLDVVNEAGGAVAGGTVLEREESRPVARTVNLTAIATTEDGTRARVLAEGLRAPALRAARAQAIKESPDGQLPTDWQPPAGTLPPEARFDDAGQPTAAAALDRVRRVLEERDHQRLLTLDEIRTMQLPPFDGQARVTVQDMNDPAYAMNGWYVGEVRGVIIFDRVPDTAHRITVTVNGASNKIRKKAAAPEAGKPENYFTSTILRRAYVVRLDFAGDEFTRQLDRYQETRSGWEWVDSLQRLDARRMQSYVAWFLDNVANATGDRNAALCDEFWPWYANVRAAYPKYADQLPDLERIAKSGDTGEAAAAPALTEPAPAAEPAPAPAEPAVEAPAPTP
jgi:hypothetical protein